MKRLFFAVFATLLLLPNTLLAATDGAPKPLGSFGLWRAYQVADHKEKICYMTLTAHFPKSAKHKRSDALLTITHRPAENSLDVVSYTAGYNFKPNSSVDIDLGKQSFNLFTAQNTAWSRDAATDHKLTAAIVAGSKIAISGTPAAKGWGSLTDHFELTGSKDAYQAIGRACGIAISVNQDAPKKAAKKH